MTATGLPDNSSPDGVVEGPPSDHPSQPESRTALATMIADSTDVDTRHRLRRALRILLAARRRDDSGAGHIENN